MTTASVTRKLPYAAWQRFRDNIHELHRVHSWREISRMFNKNDSPGWSERATVHRSIVTQADVERSRELVQESNGHRSAAAVVAPPEPEKATPVSAQTNGHLLNDAGLVEYRGHLQVLRERYGSWTAVTRALGKNPKSSGYFTDVAKGKRSGGSPEMLQLTRAIANGTTSPLEAPKSPSRTRPTRGYLKPAQKREVQERLQAMKRRHGTWASVAITLGVDPKNKSYYGKLAKTGGGSIALLKMLRQRDTARLLGDITGDDATPEAVEVGPLEVKPKREPKPRPETPSSRPWPVIAQDHLREAQKIVEHETQRLPKALRDGMAELATQITLCIEQLDIA